jgi:hypothetical protein
MENSFEYGTGNSEKTPKEVLEKQLVIAKANYDAFMETESEAYDKEVAGIYPALMGMDSITQRLFLSTKDLTLNQVVENNEKRKVFMDQARTLSSEVRNISKQIDEITNNEQRAEKKQQFKDKKEELSSKLYEALDAIHSQIPQEAKDVGMTTEMAIKQYLPKLQYEAIYIEHYINAVDKALDLEDLEYLENDIKAKKIFE